MSYTSIEQILNIEVDSEEWLAVCNSEKSALECIALGELADYVATRADREKRNPKCQLCHEPAVFDGKTKSGPWAYLCRSCMISDGVGLGLGMGSKLDTADEEVKNADDIRNFLDDDFDANELLGLSHEQLKMISIPLLTEYFETANDSYCSKEEICPTCRAALKYVSGGMVEAWGAMVPMPDEIECPNGC